jgi:hypothetical protein
MKPLVAFLVGSLVFASMAEAGAERPPERTIDLASFKIIEKESGPDRYYTVTPPPDRHIHAAYEPPFKTAVLGYEIPEGERASIAGLRWSWRAVVFPKGGDECTPGKGDSAAIIYVTWKRGLRWYTLKYVWSTVAQKGRTCASKRNPFVAQDTVIVDSGGSVGQWHTVRIVPDDEFRNHFEDGDRRASVPALVGIGILTDGDQTRSASVADYRDFVLVRR